MIQPRDLGIQVPGWREGQYEAIQNSRKSHKRFVVHNAPVGCGKSIMLVGEARMDNTRALILTGTRPLQSQYTTQFKSLNILDVRGKSNYKCRATELGGEFYDGSLAKSVAEGPCQFGVECGLKNMGCTYYDIIRQASSARLVVANYAAWISANMYGDGWGHFPLILCDEAHEAEGWLSRVMSVQIPLTIGPALGLTLPDIDDPTVWSDWARDNLPDIREALRSLQETTRTSRGGKIRSKAQVEALKVAERALTRLQDISEDWLVSRSKTAVEFQPIWVHKYAESYLFRKANKVVLASATIVPYELGLLGISKDEYDYFEYPSTFPPHRRPIYYYPVVRMRHGMDAEENLSWISVVDDFISKRLDRKGIVHTVSFARAKALLQHSSFASLMVSNSSSSTATSTLQKFRTLPPPAILVTPSMGTGVSLDYRAAEYAVIPKMPFENISDPLLVARSAEDPEHGIFQAAKNLLQMTGRLVRAPDDQGETLITDEMFGMFRGRYKYMLPKYFWDVVRKVDELPEPLEALK